MSMGDPSEDPLISLASAISDLFGEIGFAYLDDEKVEALADTLRAFFKAAEISIDEARASEHFVQAAVYYKQTVETVNGQ